MDWNYMNCEGWTGWMGWMGQKLHLYSTLDSFVKGVDQLRWVFLHLPIPLRAGN